MLPIILLGLTACVSNRPPGSVETLREQAARDVMEECLKTGFTTNRYVPLLNLLEVCERAAYGRSAHRQPVRAAPPL